MARVLFAEHIDTLVGRRDENVYSINGNSKYMRKFSPSNQPDTAVQQNTRKIFGLASQMTNAVDLATIDGSLTYLASNDIAGGRMQTEPSKRNLVSSRIITDKLGLSVDEAVANLIAFSLTGGDVAVSFSDAAGAVLGTGSAAHNAAIAIPAGAIGVKITNGSAASKISTLKDAIDFTIASLPKYDVEVYTLAV